MTVIVLILVLAPIVLAVVVLVAVIIGIHSEPRHEMTTKAQRPLAAMTRWLLGVHVIKPVAVHDDDHREKCLTGQSTDWWNKGGWDR